MRDIVWTIIAIWIIWKIYDMFKSMSKIKTQPITRNNQSNEGEIKIDKNVKLKSHFNPDDAEYVDYEEIK